MEEIICPACGASNPVESTVCESCGEDLSTIRSVVDKANQHYNQALSLAHADRIDEAIGQLEAALALNANNPQYHNLLGTLYAQREDYEAAIEAWERVLLLDPEMEKAYTNIEKAHAMLGEEEIIEESGPYKKIAFGTGILALLLIAAVVYLGMKSYRMSESITSLNQQVAERTDDLTRAQGEITEFRNTYDAILAQVPNGDIQGFIQRNQELQNLLTEREGYIERLEKQRKTEIDALRNQIAQMTQDRKQQDQELQRVRTLENMIKTNQQKIAQLEKTIQAKDAEIAAERERADKLRETTLQAQNTTRSIREDRDRAINNLMKSNENKVEELRQQILSLRNQVAEYENLKADRDQANQLMAQALQDIDKNDLASAQKRINQAQELAPEHGAVAFLQGYLQNILSNPVEQEWRNRVYQNKQQMQEAERQRLVEQYLSQAREYQRNGQYDQAITMAERVLSLSPNNSAGQQIIRDSRESSRALNMLLIEARRNMEAKNYREAERSLAQILKQAPMHTEARELQQQISR